MTKAVKIMSGGLLAAGIMLGGAGVEAHAATAKATLSPVPVVTQPVKLCKAPPAPPGAMRAFWIKVC